MSAGSPEVSAATEVAIVGAGPTGLACGIELKRLGIDALIFDKGCVVNSLYHYPTNMTFFTTPELLEIGDLPMTSIGDKPVRTEALKYYRRVTDHYGLSLRQYERVEHVAGEDGAFVIESIDRSGCRRFTRAAKVILATGYYDRPIFLNVPGEDLPKVLHYYKDPHPFYNHDVLVVGGKNSAAISALELWWSGVRVTLVHRRPTLHDNIKYWIRPNIDNRIKNGEINAYFSSTVREIRPTEVLLDTPAGPVTIKNDFVLAMTGYRPDTEFLAAHGITFDSDTRRPFTDPDTLESARPGLYLAGVLVAGMHTSEIFIENGRFHGLTIAKAIAARLRPAH